MGTELANPFQGAFQDSKRRRIAKEEASAKYVAQFRKALNIFQGTCEVCRAQGHLDVEPHLLRECPSLLPIMSPTEFITFTRSIKYGKHHKNPVCFRCHIPQVNDRLHSSFESKGDTCMFPDTLAATAMQVLYNKNIRQEACEHFKCQWPDAKAYVEWLNGPPSAGHYSRTSELFLWFSETSRNSTIRE